MVDEVLMNKGASIERCVARVREEYQVDPSSFRNNFTRQDAAILNLQRACQAALDMGFYLLKRDRLGLPQSSKDVFMLLAQANKIPVSLADNLQRMVGFRNIAVHEYQKLQIPILMHIIENHLDDFLIYSKTLLLNESKK